MIFDEGPDAEEDGDDQQEQVVNAIAGFYGAG